MMPSHHILISGAVFSFAYLRGLSGEFVLIGFFAAILIDIDHFLLGSIAGGYSPSMIYEFSKKHEILRSFTWREILRGKLLGTRLFPLHNIWICGALLWLWLPAGFGFSLHLILDAYYDAYILRSFASAASL